MSKLIHLNRLKMNLRLLEATLVNIEGMSFAEGRKLMHLRREKEMKLLKKIREIEATHVV